MCLLSAYKGLKLEGNKDLGESKKGLLSAYKGLKLSTSLLFYLFPRSLLSAYKGLKLNLCKHVLPPWSEFIKCL